LVASRPTTKMSAATYLQLHSILDRTSTVLGFLIRNRKVRDSRLRVGTDYPGSLERPLIF